LNPMKTGSFYPNRLAPRNTADPMTAERPPPPASGGTANPAPGREGDVPAPEAYLWKATPAPDDGNPH